MRKFLANILTFVFIISTVLNGVFPTTVFAATEETFQDVALNWDKENTLDDSLNSVQKGNKYDEVFLWWNFGIKNGMNVDSGKYDLSYNIQNNKRIDFTINKVGDVAEITYKVWEYSNSAYMDLSNGNFQVYDNNSGSYIRPNQTNFPPIQPGKYEIIYDNTGNPTEAKFNIILDTGFSMKFDNKVVRFKWVKGRTNDVFYFATNGASQGNIYDFNLKLDTAEDTIAVSDLKIFTGINATSFQSKAYANERTELIEQIQRPISNSNYPGYDPEIEMTFDMPKIWNATTNKFEFADDSNPDEADPTRVIIYMGHADDSKKLQITLEDIYKYQKGGAPINDPSYHSFSPGNETTEVFVNRTDNNKVVVNIKHLEAGTIYNPVEITLGKPENSVQKLISETSVIEQGKVYTYPIFSVISKSANEYYLEIEPFKGYNGYYVVQKGQTPDDVKDWAQTYDPNNGEKNIYVPIPLNAINQEVSYFKVNFRFTPPDSSGSSGQIGPTSQVLKFKAHQSDIVIDTPKNLTITDLAIVPAKGDITKKELVMTLSWEVAIKNVILNLIEKAPNNVLDVEYTFNKGDKPYDENEQPFLKVKMAATYKDSNKDDISIIFSDAENKNRLEKTEDGNYGSWSYKNELVGTSTYSTLIDTVTVRLPISSKEEGGTQFLYPNIYFLNTFGEYVDSSGKKVTTGASLPKDITIDNVTDEDVPQPQNVEIINTSDNKVGMDNFGVKWSTHNGSIDGTMMNNYYKKMLKPRGFSLNDQSIKYNAFITQDKSLLDEFMKYNDDLALLPEEIQARLKKYNHGNKSGVNPINAASTSMEDGTIMKDWLRKDNLVEIDNILQIYGEDISYQQFNFTGLDKNQDYYVIIQTVVIPYQVDADNPSSGQYLYDEIDYSSFSDIVTATTMNNEDEPGPEDNIPSAPQNFDKTDVTLSSVKLFWNRVKETVEPGKTDVLEYQIIRMRGNQMLSEELKTRDSFEETWARLPSDTEKTGLRTQNSDIYTYSGTGFSDTPADKTKYDYNTDDNVINSLIDYTLSTNELYFYYLRTVRVVDGVDKAYSIWVPLSITTNPVSSPTNLKVERDREYDKKTEVVVSFDSPKIDIDKLGSEFDFQYSIKTDDKEWLEPKTMSAAKLKASYKTNNDGTLHFEYTITGLEPSTLYYIKVRLYNNELKDGSLYTNIVQVRTDIDPDQNIDDIEKEKWVDYYTSKLMEIGKEPYWYAENKGSSVKAIYRPKYFDIVLNSSPSSSVKLVPGDEDGNHKTYYIPATAIDQAFEAEKGFSISWEGMDVYIAPKSIDSSLNDAILDIRDRMKTKDAEDYFVKITISFTRAGMDIEGNQALSPMADITVEAVGTDENIASWDDFIYRKLEEKVFDEDDLQDVIDDIIDEVQDDTSSEDMIGILKDYIDEFKEDFMDYVDDELDDILNKKYTSRKLNGNMVISYAIDQNASAIGYMQNNSIWNEIELNEYNSKKAIYTTVPGVYVIAGKTVNIPGISGVDNGTPITRIVVKYGLDDYLGKDEAFNLNAKITKGMAVGVAARIAGAPKSSDPMQYLSSKGINISSRGSQNAIESQEAVYLVMMVYQTRTGKNIDTIKIRNYTLTQNIKGVNSNYLKAIQAAFEVGIYTNKNMIPKEGMTVNEYLQMIVKLSEKVGL